MVNLVDQRRPMRHRGLILVLVLCVGLSTLVVMPRPVVPQHLPLPTLELGRLSAEQERLNTLRENTEPLGYDMRVVGELFRRFGRAEAVSATSEAIAFAREVKTAAARVLEGSSPLHLARLRSLQTDLFLRHLAERPRGSPPSSELEELGGSLTQRLIRWEVAVRRPLEDAALMAALFRVRWARVTGATRGQLAVTSNDWRRYYRLQLEHPELFTTRRDAQVRLQASAIDGLASVDLRYPARLARGILRYSQGRYGSALSEFRAHLAGSAGSYRLRAQNYAAAAAARAVRAEPAPASR